MNFSSPVFLFLFLPAVLLLYYLPLARRSRQVWQDFVLVASSLLFYFWGEGSYVSVMLVSVTLSWFFGLCVAGSSGRTRLLYLGLGVAANAGLLFYFKYFAFLVNSLAPRTSPVDVHLPIGISFFTFQAISYLIDIY